MASLIDWLLTAILCFGIGLAIVMIIYFIDEIHLNHKWFRLSEINSLQTKGLDGILTPSGKESDTEGKQ